MTKGDYCFNYRSVIFNNFVAENNKFLKLHITRLLISECQSPHLRGISQNLQISKYKPRNSEAKIMLLGAQTQTHNNQSIIASKNGNKRHCYRMMLPFMK